SSELLISAITVIQPNSGRRHDGKDDVQTNSRIQTAVISAPQRPIAFGFCVRRISLLRADHDPIARARGAAPLVVWSGRMRTIGAICLLRPQALAALAGCDPIIHAGDVGSPDVLARLGALAPVHAVRGNVDHGAWSANLPVTQRIEIDGFRIYVL